MMKIRDNKLIKTIILFTILVLLAVGAETNTYRNYSYRVVNVYPHDISAFTQGLVFADGFLYEGTGMNGESGLRKVNIENGQVLESHLLDEKYFGEGVTIFEDRIIQLTWKSKTGFAYDRESFGLIEEFYYPTEGWGLTTDGERLIMSDGTAKIYFLDPFSFVETSFIEVSENGKPFLGQLNELEFIDGEIFANVWPTNQILRISPVTGKILGKIDLTGLLNPGDQHPNIDVLNGIAYDHQNKRLFVTGKRWPKLFEIELIPLN
ncbi:MAG: glutaminyl-peptide cyclotransferase [Calditrichia bacterium]